LARPIAEFIERNFSGRSAQVSIESGSAYGRTVEVDGVIAADGVRSVVRRFVAGDDGLLYSRTSGFRGIVPIGKLPSLPDPQAIQFWMGPSAHLLHYAIGADGGHVNFLAVVEGPRDWPYPEKGLAASNDAEALALFQGWHPAVTEMIAAVRHEVRWGLFLARPLRRWRRGRVVLLGDAAHAMLPHLGQGANQAIEDGVALAVLLEGKTPADVPDTLRGYERFRRVRTDVVQAESRQNGLRYDSRYASLEQRDREIRNAPALRRWLYDYDVEQAAQEMRRAA
jgi:salicylate hydroxylase